ncbi:MAG TPA: hypothetical protein V6D30_22350 [Leptolyngbyaceae cyanobacterium]
MRIKLNLIKITLQLLVFAYMAQPPRVLTKGWTASVGKAWQFIQFFELGFVFPNASRGRMPAFMTNI